MAAYLLLSMQGKGRVDTLPRFFWNVLIYDEQKQVFRLLQDCPVQESLFGCSCILFVGQALLL